ncbi:MAG: hypothetical protein QNJ31_04440 [Candidatus Caenarcaniphilales bacterium]|nr:hypothetical protein [Candidatus Caenarcaniphilales bacterium]
MRSNLKYYDYSPSISNEGIASSKKRKHLKLVEDNYKPDLSVYSSTPDKRFLAALKKLNKKILNLSIIGLISAAISYFCLLSLESEVARSLDKFNYEMKNREDLRSYLGKVYSWANIDKAARENNLSEVEKIEFAKVQKTSFDKIFEVNFE